MAGDPLLRFNKGIAPESPGFRHGEDVARKTTRLLQSLRKNIPRTGQKTNFRRGKLTYPLTVGIHYTYHIGIYCRQPTYQTFIRLSRFACDNKIALAEDAIVARAAKLRSNAAFLKMLPVQTPPCEFGTTVYPKRSIVWLTTGKSDQHCHCIVGMGFRSKFRLG